MIGKHNDLGHLDGGSLCQTLRFSVRHLAPDRTRRLVFEASAPKLTPHKRYAVLPVRGWMVEAMALAMASASLWGSTRMHYAGTFMVTAHVF